MDIAIGNIHLPYLSSVVKKERLKLGLKQVEFAKNIGIGLKTLRKIEQGDLNISFQKLNYVLNFFGLELAPMEIVTKPIKKETKVLLKEDIVEVLERVLPIFKIKYKIKEMFLFGSYAKGTESESSDIDVLISTGRVLKFEEEEEIKLILETLFKGVEVDLTIKENLINEFREEILGSRIEIKERI